jgi:hypothetical protein
VLPPGEFPLVDIPLTHPIMRMVYQVTEIPQVPSMNHWYRSGETGMAASLVAPTTRYVWFDNDLLKLRGFLSRRVDGLAVLGSVERLPFRDEAFDWTLMVDVTHHLPDEVLDHALSEVARVTRRAFVFSDALRSGRRRSDLLWHLDLGRYPRTEGPLLDALGAYFTVESVERFRINHDHVLCVCVPRQGRDISLDQ